MVKGDAGVGPGAHVEVTGHGAVERVVEVGVGVGGGMKVVVGQVVEMAVGTEW